MLSLPAAAAPVLLALTDPLVQPTAQRLLLLIVGAILTTGRRTITHFLATTGNLAQAPGPLRSSWYSQQQRLVELRTLVMCLAAVQQEPSKFVIPRQRRTLVARVQRVGLHGLPALRVPNEYPALARHAFEHHHPLGAPMIPEAVIVARVGVEASWHPPPGVVLEEPSVPERPAACLVFGAAVQEAAFEVGIVSQGRVSASGGCWPAHFLPRAAVEHLCVA